MPRRARLRRLGKFALLLLAAVALVASCATAPSRATRDGLLILVSIDGFRWDYLDRYDLPNLRALAAGGVRARRMNSSFPTKTFPNHYTLVTGLRPETHGIVANEFFDPATNGMFDKSKTESHWWEGGEPVWITAEKQGVRSAVLHWPGGETELQGRRPSFWERFDKTATSAGRIERILGWLDRPASERPRFCAVYLDVVDIAAHRFGPDSPEAIAAARDADAAIGRLLAGLEERGLRERANVVIVSDHGLADCGADRVIFFEDMMDVSQVQIESAGPNGGVRPKPGTVSAAELAANIRAKAPLHLKVYLREEVPAQWHYRANPRIPPVVLICDPHWNIERKEGWGMRRAIYNVASHGWDPAMSEMGALFVAAGPAFRRGYTIGTVENIDLYNMLCAALEIRAAPNEGGQELARAALK